MKKSSLVIFCVFAIIGVLLIPLIAIETEGGADASPNNVAASDAGAKTLFFTNCGTCHTLAAAGTHGVVGPNLDVILTGDLAKQVATFVGKYAGQP
jgi:cytochrome c2